MKWCSQRVGAKSVPETAQIESMDDNLKSRIWNVIYVFFLEDMNHVYGFSPDELEFIRRVWHRYFRKPINHIPSEGSQVVRYLEQSYSRFQWSEVYGFIECMLFCYPDDGRHDDFIEACNETLKEELSGYRIVEGFVTPITSKDEIDTIKDAIADAPSPVTTQLKRALDHFSDRENPDYRNSIKESISAVEALCKLIADDTKLSLGEALKKIEREDILGIHKAILAGFSKFYGWASDADGIRHALMEESTVDTEDARYMLVSCSAFVNYLIVKADKAGIKL